MEKIQLCTLSTLVPLECNEPPTTHPLLRCQWQVQLEIPTIEYKEIF